MPGYISGLTNLGQFVLTQSRLSNMHIRVFFHFSKILIKLFISLFWLSSSETPIMQMLELLSLTSMSFSLYFFRTLSLFSFCFAYFYISVLHAPSCVSQCGHSALGSFQSHVSFSFTESFQLIFHLFASMIL